MKLTASGLSKSYTAHPVLNIQEVMFGGHGIEGLIGPNGAGKSTLLGCLTRRIPPTTGSVTFEKDGRDHDLISLSSHQVAQLGLVKTNQRIQGFESLTIRDQLRMAATPPEREGWRFSWKPDPGDPELEATIDALLNRFPFSNPDGFAKSGGEKKLVDILRCLIVRPKMLLMDEPTAGLPDEITQEVMALVRSRVEEGELVVLIIEHDLELIWNNCDYVHFLSEGELLFQGDPDEVKNNRVVAEKYMGI
ncbi:ATP-binding cassette domain-containing protein [Roseibium sp. HPY-6]|uniref:ABC transporter ATP-binding protein n=1 Tax=Roseibium sp. HPY-6 TaxID=3229852 RepID=UPI00338EAB7B